MSRAKLYTQAAPVPKATKACYLAPELEAIQHLMPMGKDDLARLRVSIKADGIRDALKGYPTEQGFAVLSGAHRLQIAREEGLATVPTEIVNLPDARAREAYAFEENLARRHLDTEAKRALVRHVLKAHPELSDRAIGARVGVDGKTVATQRQELESSTAEIPQLETRTGADGKTRRKPKPEHRKTQQRNEKARKDSEESPAAIKRQIKGLETEARELERQAKGKRTEAEKLRRKLEKTTAKKKAKKRPR